MGIQQPVLREADTPHEIGGKDRRQLLGEGGGDEYGVGDVIHPWTAPAPSRLFHMPPHGQGVKPDLAAIGAAGGEPAALTLIIGAGSDAQALLPAGAVFALEQALEGPARNDEAATEPQAGQLYPQKVNRQVNRAPAGAYPALIHLPRKICSAGMMRRE